jgi:hypothetical protein
MRWHMGEKTRLLVWNVMMFLSLPLFGCGPKLYDYSFELSNDRNSGECAFLLESPKGFFLQSNHIVAKTWKTYSGPYKYPPNDLYTVRWIDENGDYYSAEADFRTAISKKFKGYLVFKVNSQNNLIYSASRDYKGEEIFSKVSRGKKEEKLTPSKSGKTSGLT